MKRKTVSRAMLILLSINMLTLAFNIQQVKATGTIYIRADGSVDPDTAHLSSVDNITYTFTDNIYDEIVIERDNIVVDGVGYSLQGTGNGNGIDLSSRRNVTIKNIEIKTFMHGVWLSSSSNNTIFRNNITMHEYQGIILDESSNNTISGNKIMNTGSGIVLRASNYNCISGNTITNTSGWGIFLWVLSTHNSIFRNSIINNDFGISLDGSSNNTLRNNDVSNNKYNFDVYGNYMQDIDVSNTVNGKPVYYWVNRRDMAVPLDAGYVALVNCTRMRVKNLNFTNNGQGVLLAFTTNSTITNNNITNNYFGLLLVESSKNSVSGNTITNNLFGILLKESSNNNLYENNITGNSEKGAVFIRSNYNVIHHNNFVDNYVQALSDGVNIWNDGYPSGGNYWSDYTGTDANGDGIGDTPYFIYVNNQDNYPLMKPWSPPTMIKTLIRTVKFWNLSKGTENSLTSKLEGALHLLDIGKENAVHKLMALMNQVEASGGKKLTNEQANYLTAEAQRIIDLIKGETP